MKQNTLMEAAKLLKANNLQLEIENEKLKEEKRSFDEIYTAKCLAEEAIMSSLNELMIEQDEERKKEIEAVKLKVN